LDNEKCPAGVTDANPVGGFRRARPKPLSARRVAAQRGRRSTPLVIIQRARRFTGAFKLIGKDPDQTFAVLHPRPVVAKNWAARRTGAPPEAPTPSSHRAIATETTGTAGAQPGRLLHLDDSRAGHHATSKDHGQARNSAVTSATDIVFKVRWRQRRRYAGSGPERRKLRQPRKMRNVLKQGWCLTGLCRQTASVEGVERGCHRERLHLKIVGDSAFHRRLVPPPGDAGCRGPQSFSWQSSDQTGRKLGALDRMPIRVSGISGKAARQRRNI